MPHFERNPPIHIRTEGNYLTITINIPWEHITNPRHPANPYGPDGKLREPPPEKDPNIMQRFVDKVLEIYHQCKDIKATAKEAKTRCQTVRRIVQKHEVIAHKAQRTNERQGALELINKGIPLSEVARITGRHRETLKRWLKA